MKIESAFTAFFDANISRGAKILIGLSGGADSIALLHLFLRVRKKYNITLHVAHVDHRWRVESSSEAEQLRDIVENYGIPFHLSVLDPGKIIGNLESACRDERLVFFRDICQRYGLDAVALGHHRDDRAETVLKRVFEGSSIFALAALAPVVDMEDLTILRPLISLAKREIVSWLSLNKISFFTDVTNDDIRYMRARTRHRIIPALADQFGKEIAGNLCHLADEASRVKNFIETIIESVLATKRVSSLGVWYDVTSPLHAVPLEYFLRKACNVKNVHLTRDMLSVLSTALSEKKGNISVLVGTRRVVVDRGNLFILENMRPLEGRHALFQGSNRCGSWLVEVSDVIEMAGDELNTSWRSFWSGGASVMVPKGEYLLGIADRSEFFPRMSPIKKLWNSTKTPAFLRAIVPVLYRKNGEIVHDFLSGRGRVKYDGERDLVAITIKPC